MANSKSNGDRYSYATIDTAPGADGYWCDSVSMSKKNAGCLFFSYGGGGVATVTLQFQRQDDTGWTDYLTDETLTDGARLILDDHGAGVKWRAGVKNGGLSSGTNRIGFDW